ncbi:CPBP family intramembrane glutamic endopeptidase [Tumebacillus lipolyticus]|uniref:CPBP family intramembrane glutamic endopeptidase n=1 Tax=Tumebacillus lipolyticus TaxID=1280370 RepID=A0ABW5A0N0_9BACL
MKRNFARKVQMTGAILLIWAFFQDILLTLSSMTFIRGEHGKWQLVLQSEKIAPVWSILALLFVLFGVIAFVGGFLAKKRVRKRDEQGRSKLTLRDLFVSLGWVGLLFFGGVFFYYFGGSSLIPEWFRTSPGASSLGGVSMQIAAILVIPIYFRKGLSEIGLKRPMLSWKMAGYVLMFFVFVYTMSLLTNSLSEWVGIDTDSYREKHISQELLDAKAFGMMMSMLPLLSTAVIAPLGEELLFRGVLQSVLTARWGASVGVVGSALLFSLIHADPVLFLPIFIMGVLFSMLYRITGTLWAPIWLHALNNLVASIHDLL